MSATNLVVDAGGQTGELGGLQQHQHRPGRRARSGGPAGTFGEAGHRRSPSTTSVQHTWYTTAGTFTLPNLSLGFGGSC